MSAKNNELIRDIADYFGYLEGQGLMVSFHSKYHGPLSPFIRRLLRYNHHTNNYCVKIKSSRPVWLECMKCQKQLLEKSSGGSFFHTCYAGVSEYVYPIGLDEPVGIVCVSGYRTSGGENAAPIRKIAENYGFDPDALLALHGGLSPDIPPKEKIDVLIKPLCHMLRMLALTVPTPPESTDGRGEAAGGNEIFSLIAAYIYENYRNSLSIGDICEYCHYSKSHVSHVFKKHTGMNVAGFVNRLRVEDAKRLLAETSLPISVISARVGFSDSNYFTNVFHSMCGVSPRGYRARAGETSEGTF